MLLRMYDATITQAAAVVQGRRVVIAVVCLLTVRSR
jgi:hypothetical protein